MSDLEKAQALLADRTYKLKNISRDADIPYITIRTYSQYPKKLKTAAWIRVHRLARMYDMYDRMRSKMEVRIYAGKKLEKLVDGKPWIDIEVKPDDVGTVYDIIAENIVLKDHSEKSQDLVDFQNCKDDDVETMLKDLKRMDFIDYEINDNSLF